jgi:hypothetical protein
MAEYVTDANDDLVSQNNIELENVFDNENTSEHEDIKSIDENNNNNNNNNNTSNNIESIDTNIKIKKNVRSTDENSKENIRSTDINESHYVPIEATMIAGKRKVTRSRNSGELEYIVKNNKRILDMKSNSRRSRRRMTKVDYNNVRKYNKSYNDYVDMLNTFVNDIKHTNSDKKRKYEDMIQDISKNDNVYGIYDISMNDIMYEGVDFVYGTTMQESNNNLLNGENAAEWRRANKAVYDLGATKTLHI